MIKLNRPVEMLEDILERLESKIEALQEKQQAIEENAAEHDRDMTANELARYGTLEEQIDELQAERDEIENALDYLREYVD